MKLVIAGGGTGGHIFSGLAVAQEWQKRGGEVVFIGTARGLETQLVPRFGFDLELIRVGTLKGGRLASQLKTLLGIPRALWQSFRLLKKYGAQFVLGIGGYASGPVVLAAKLLGLKTALIDQNSIPGWTNRVLGRWAQRIYLTFDEAKNHFDSDKVLLTGNPVMESRLPLITKKSEGPPTLLVCGGSQGAHAVNKIILESLEELAKKFPQLQFVMQTGQADFVWVKEQLKNKKIPIQVAPFFDDIDTYYAKATVVIARSGAGTLTELALWGLPSLLIPYPYAADDHQKKNAEHFEKAGAAFVLDQDQLTSALLVQQVGKILSNSTLMASMRVQAKNLARPQAARDVVDDLLKV